MADDAPRALTCLIEGDSSLFQVNVTGGENIMVLKDLIREKRKNGVLSNVDAADLTLWKVDLASPPKPGRERFSLKNVPGALELDEADEILEHWPPTLPDLKHLRIIVELPLPPVLGKRSRAADDLIDLSWLREVHKTLWNQEDLRPKLFRKVKITQADYTALEKLLEKPRSDRSKLKYDVLEVKLNFLHSLKQVETSPSPHLDDADSEARKEVASSKARNEIADPEPSNEAADPDPISEDEVVLQSLFPYNLEFFDLSALALKVVERLPLPLLLRKEYKIISKLIENEPEGSRGSVLVSGQPGTGKTAYLYLRIIEYVIEGRPFLFQADSETVYHVTGDGVDVVQSLPEYETIVAFVDGDDLSKPRKFLLHHTVQLIVASSPKITSQKWIKQGGDTVTELAIGLWSQEELLLTGIFLNRYDLPFKLLRDSTSYFGYNPRQCFSASSSVDELNAKRDRTKSVIEEVAACEDFLRLFRATKWGLNDVSHRIFQLSPTKENRLLSSCEFQPFSRWAFDLLLHFYEQRKSDAATDFYFTISGISDAAVLQGHLFERQVLRHLFRAESTYSIRGLANPNETMWKGHEAIRHFVFEDSTIVDELTKVVLKQEPVHLVPSARNFAAVDSILYNPNDPDAVLTCIQVTMQDTHAISVKGLRKIQGWLARGSTLKDLRPSKNKPWRFVFVVRSGRAGNFTLQNFCDDKSKSVGDWPEKVQQYVLGLEEKTIFRRSDSSASGLQQGAQQMPDVD